MFGIKAKGDFKKTESFLSQAKKASRVDVLEVYADKVLRALENATPVDTGKTAQSWYYKIERNGNSAKVSYYNKNEEGNCSVALLLQYGHAARNGRWVPGIDYINPAVKPIFDEIQEAAWKEVIKG